MAGQLYQTPSNWRPMAPNSDCELVKLHRNSKEYKKIERAIGDPCITSGITKICRVQNPYIYGEFLKMKDQYDSKTNGNFQVLQLYHDTNQNCAISIAENNFDWRRHTKRTRYGKGVCFATTAEYGRIYSSCDIQHRAIFVADVLVGKSCPGTYTTKKPPKGFDTTIGNRKQVYVKYKDNEFYPKYVAYYLYDEEDDDDYDDDLDEDDYYVDNDDSNLINRFVNMFI